MMETGAYNVDWPHVHMQPEQTLQAHIDLKGRWLLPIPQRHVRPGVPRLARTF
jgi:hypothetical protein